MKRIIAALMLALTMTAGLRAAELKIAVIDMQKAFQEYEKTKTIEIGGGRHRISDVVGVDLFSGVEGGCPAVRIAEKKGVLRVVAAGLVPPPAAPRSVLWLRQTKR